MQDSPEHDAERPQPVEAAALREETPTAPAEAPTEQLPAQTPQIHPEPVKPEPIKAEVKPDKETPVLEVEMPYTSHNWKDFFIHIATISVGLLIAIGLEQSVEAIHRAHSRHALIEDFHAECRDNLKVIAADLAGLKSARNWDIAAVKTLNAAPVINGHITVVFPKLESHPPSNTPSRAVWSVAKASGKVALLPENIAEVYDRVDYEGEQFVLANSRTNDEALTRFTMSVGSSPIMLGTTLHLTIAQRDQLVDTLATIRSQLDNMCNWLASWQGASQAVLDGVVKREAMDDYVQRAHKALQMDK
jgi:hypothetical protein